MRLRGRLVRTLRALLAAAGGMLLVAAAPADAAIFYVGAPGDRACDFTDIQAAIDHVRGVPGHDVIRLTARDYMQQALVIDDEDGLSLVGYYDECANPTSVGLRLWLHGAGGAQAPIISVRGGGTVKLHFLELWGNTEGKGLEVDCEGCTVQLLDVGVRWNAQGVTVSTANCVGNCTVPARLIVNDRVDVIENHFVGDVGVNGAGIAVQAAVLDMSHAPGSQVSDNVAKWDGGGIWLGHRASGRVAVPVFNNTAGRDGGGIAVVHGSTLLLYPTSSKSVPKLVDNEAAFHGGGLYVEDAWLEPGSSVIGWDATFEANRAEHGGAVYVKSLIGGPARLCLRSLATVPEADSPCPERAPRDAVSCPDSGLCNAIVDNLAEYFGGAVMSSGAHTQVHLSHQLVTSNIGWSVLGHYDAGGQTSEEALVRIDDSLVARNQPAFATVLNRFAPRTIVRRSTVADNDAIAFYLDDSPDFELSESVVWEPGEASLFRGGTSGADLVRMVLASEVDSLGPAPDVQAVADPRFMSSGDYRLREDSPAVDFSDSATVQPDLAGRARGVDLPGVFDLYGPADLGAYERQPVPIVTSP